jgi:outer membrane receptor for ferrienterochelin and colicins
MVLLTLLISLVHATEVETIVITDQKIKTTPEVKIKDTIVKTEVITQKKIEKKQAKSFTESLTNEPGIDVVTQDPSCGLKKVRINGLEGEYTNVLIDDIPLHSTVSSFYALEGITTKGIESIEIARGSGTNLVTPYGIGGTVNIKTKKITKDQLNLDGSIGNQSYNSLSIFAGKISTDEKTKLMAAAQHNEQGQWDADNNGLTESPNLKNNSLFFKLNHDLNDKNEIELRLANYNSKVQGGKVSSSSSTNTAVKGTNDNVIRFEGNNVGRKYTGGEAVITEMVETNRQEVTTKLYHRFNQNLQMVPTFSFANQKQDSLYTGSDYNNVDLFYFTDLRFNYSKGDKHIITFGADYRQETMKSNSYQFYGVLGNDKDDFIMKASGVYIQDIWQTSEKLQTSLALRADEIMVDWTAKKASNNEISRFMLAPRISLQYTHSSHFTSRFSSGIGYRAPVAFFESEHGFIENGYDIKVTKLEKSRSFNYALNFNREKTSAGFGATYTSLKNRAYIDNSGARPALATLGNTVKIGSFEATFGQELSKELNLGLTLEKFIYDRMYQRSLVIAATEERAKLNLDFTKEKYTFSTNLNWIGARNLERYGYGNRYDGFHDNNSNGKLDSGDTADLNTKKSTKAPSFYTIDVIGRYQFTSNYALEAGVKNLLDYTQAKETAPHFIDANGSLDSTFIWGPLRGRQVYAGLKADF